jgi:hypothetical protein
MDNIILESGKASRGRPALVFANLMAFSLLLVSGIVHGRLTERWGTSSALAEAIARLDRVPRSIGDWRARDVAMDRRQIERAGIQGYLSRTYHNVRDGREVTVLLVCGRPGPIAVHTPDICYKGSGYESDSEPVVRPIAIAGDHPAEFLKARFAKAGAPVPDVLDILWAWNARGIWEVPAYPRIAFAAYPSLYKVYVITRRDGVAPSLPGGSANDEEFAGLIVKALNQALSVRDGPATVTSSAGVVPAL